MLAGPAAIAGANPAESLIEGRKQTTSTAPTQPVETPVSTRPESLRALDPLATEVDRESAPEARPLTRAAAQKRIEGMSPAGWLAGYGPVTIGRPD